MGLEARLFLWVMAEERGQTGVRALVGSREGRARSWMGGSLGPYERGRKEQEGRLLLGVRTLVAGSAFGFLP